MPNFNKAIKFILTFFGVYFVLILLVGTSGLKADFTEAFADWTSNTYKHFIPQTELSFQPVEDMGEYDLLITYMNLKTKTAKVAEAQQAGLTTANLDVSSSQFSVWDYFLLQFILLFSLTIASPFSWKRKGIAFLIGSFVLAAFTFHRFNCSLKYYAKISPVIEPQELSNFEEKYVNAIFSMQSVEFIFIFTFIIWALTTFSKKDIWLINK